MPRPRGVGARAYYAIGRYFGAPPKEEQLDRLLQVMPLERMLGPSPWCPEIF